MVAAGILKGIGEDGHGAEIARVVHLLRRVNGRRRARVGVEGHGAKGIAEDVAEESGSDRLLSLPYFIVVSWARVRDCCVECAGYRMCSPIVTRGTTCPSRCRSRELTRFIFRITAGNPRSVELFSSDEVVSILLGSGNRPVSSSGQQVYNPPTTGDCKQSTFPCTPPAPRCSSNIPGLSYFNHSASVMTFVPHRLIVRSSPRRHHNSPRAFRSLRKIPSPLANHPLGRWS